MDILPIRRHRGIRQIGEGLGTLDREVFEAIAESPSPLLDSADAAADPGRGPFKAVVRDRRGACGDRAPSLAAGCGARRDDPRRHQSVHQPGRQAGLEAAAPKSRSGAVGETEQAVPDVELASIGPLCERGRLRGRRRPREPPAGAGTRTTGRTGGPVAGGHRRALSRRCVRRLRHRRCHRRARRTDSAADRTDEDSHRGSASARNPCPSAGRGRGSGDQSCFRQRNGGARRRASS